MNKKSDDDYDGNSGNHNDITLTNISQINSTFHRIENKLMIISLIMLCDA